MRRWFAVAVGGLGWRPKDFWRASVGEYLMAIDGHNETQQSSGPTPMTRAEFEALEAKYITNG